MISTEIIVPLLMFAGSCLLWVRVRRLSALFMAVGFFLVLASTAYSMFGPPAFVINAEGVVPNELYDLLSGIIYWGKSAGGILASVSFFVFALRL